MILIGEAVADSPTLEMRFCHDNVVRSEIPAIWAETPQRPQQLKDSSDLPFASDAPDESFR